MFPNNMGMPLDMPVRKRRVRKKKPQVVDPEAERQERELRMKIKQSLHTQQVLRTEVEEEEAQHRNFNVNNVVDPALRGGSMAGRTNNNMGNQMNQAMIGMAMGYGGVQQQMGGMGMQQPQQQQQQQPPQQHQQYQFNSQNQKYGYQQNQEGLGMSSNVPNIEQQMQQMKQQLELQRQQLEQQLKMKQQMEMQQQQQKQQQQQNNAQKGSQIEIMRSLKYEQERMLNEAQTRGYLTKMGNDMSASQSPGPNTPSPGYSRTESPQYMPAQYQQESPNYRRSPQVTAPQSNQQPQQQQPQQQQQQQQFHQQQNGMPQSSFANQQDQKKSDQNQYLPYNYRNQSQQQQSYQTQQNQGGNQGEQQQTYLSQQNQGGQQQIFQQPRQNQTQQQQYQQRQKNETQAQSYQPQQNQAAQPQSCQTQHNQSNQQSYQSQQTYPSQQGAPYNQHSNGGYSQNSSNKKHEPKSPTPKSPTGLKNSQETHDKSLFSSSSNTESWLKAGSVNSSFSNSLAFHSVGNMSASFNSAIGDTPLHASGTSGSQSNVPNDVVLGSSGEEGRLRDSEGSANKGVGVDTKKSRGEISSGVGSGQAQAPAGPRNRMNEVEAGCASFNKGYTDTNVGLKPIQENEPEADDSANQGDKFAKNSLMMSLLEGELLQSARSGAFGESSMSMNDLMMSLDSTTFQAIMKQSQSGGEMNISMSDLIESVGNNNKDGEDTAERAHSAPSSGGSPPKLSKRSDSLEDKSYHPHSERTLKTGSSSRGESVTSSVTMNDGGSESPNRLSRNSKESSVRSRGSRTTVSKISMFSEISQWTKNNPFEQSSHSNGSDSPANQEGGGAPDKKKQQLRQLQGDVNGDSLVDMGDFHSLGGSIENSLDISMMSSMTGEMNESLRNLDISSRDVEKKPATNKWL